MAGNLFYERCKRLIFDAEQPVHELEQFRCALGGHVKKISAAIAFGRLHLIPVITTLPGPVSGHHHRT